MAMFERPRLALCPPRVRLRKVVGIRADRIAAEHRDAFEAARAKGLRAAEEAGEPAAGARELAAGTELETAWLPCEIVEDWLDRGAAESLWEEGDFAFDAVGELVKGERIGLPEVWRRFVEEQPQIAEACAAVGWETPAPPRRLRVRDVREAPAAPPAFGGEMKRRLEPRRSVSSLLRDAPDGPRVTHGRERTGIAQFNEEYFDFLVRHAVADLLARLADGELVAEGLGEGAAPAPVPAALFADDDTVLDIDEGKVLQRERKELRCLCRGVVVRGGEAGGAASAAAVTALRKEIRDEVARDIVPASKEARWRAAGEAHPGITRRQFDEVWRDEAAAAWKTPGRKPGR